MALKQELKDAVKVSRKTFFNPSGWFGYKMFASQVQTTVALVRRLFVPESPKRIETFEAALERMKIKESDLIGIYNRYLLFALFFAAVGAILVTYGIYLFFHKDTLAGFCLAIASGGLAFVNAFRFHFLSFQIRVRKLGCTLQEWLSGKVNKSDKA